MEVRAWERVRNLISTPAAGKSTESVIPVQPAYKGAGGYPPVPWVFHFACLRAQVLSLVIGLEQSGRCSGQAAVWLGVRNVGRVSWGSLLRFRLFKTVWSG